MATTATVMTVGQRKGPSGPTGELNFYECVVRCSGTYATASKPSFDFLAALQAGFAHTGITAVSVKSAVLLRDAFTSDGTRQTAPNAQIALSGTGNATITFRIDEPLSDAERNGIGGTEIADATVTDGEFVFLVACEVTRF